MRATVNQPKTPVGNTEKSLRLPLEKLKSNNFLSSSRVRAINGKRLKRLFMSKVSTSCIREEKITALKLHEVICETLQVDIPLRNFRVVLKGYGKDMSSSFEFDDFLEIIRQISKETSKTTVDCCAGGSGDSTTVMRMKQEQANTPVLLKALSPGKHSINKQGDVSVNNQVRTERTDRSQKRSSMSHQDQGQGENSVKKQSQTARELHITPLEPQALKDHAKTVSPEINNPQAPAPTEASDQTAAVCSPGRPLVPEHLDERHSSCSVPNQRSGCPQFAAQAISIKKLEPNLVRLFISDNSEKAEYTVNTKAVLGKGSFGKVFKGHSNSNKNFAVKELTSEFEEFEKNWKRTISRKSVQEKLRKCPYIYKIIHIAEERKRRKYWHVFEMVEGISLHKIAHEKKDLVYKDQNLKLWFSQLFSAVHFLNYKLNIVHRDIKTDNVLILQNPSRIKLIDFDHAALWNEPITTSAGAPICLPPEVLMHGQHKYTPAADWWMIGVLLYDVITGRHPFLICKTLSETRGPRRSIDYDLTEENIKAGFKGFNSEYCSRLPNGARSLVHELLTYDPRLRLGFSCHDFECRILKHTFFLDLDWNRIWKWVEHANLEQRMASSGDAKTRSRVSSVESPIKEEVATEFQTMGRTPTPKTSLYSKHGGNKYADNNGGSGHSRRTNSISYSEQQRRKSTTLTSSDTSSGIRWAHTARTSPLTMKSHDASIGNHLKRQAQTSRSPMIKNMLAKSISRNVAADCYNNQFTRAPGGPEKQVPPIPVTPFQVQPCNNSNTARNNSPLKTKSFQGAPQIPTQGGAGAQASQNKYMTIQALPCTVGIDGSLDTRGHQ